MSPRNGERRPKNKNDQSVFARIWAAKNATACRTGAVPVPSFTTTKSAMPIRIKSVVHTGPKTHAGGAKDGFWSVAYHVGIASIVKTEPIAPARRGIAMQRINRPAAVRDFLFIQDQR